MDCELASELAAAYALGALSDEDHRDFQAHIATCANHDEELAEHRRVARGLAAAVEPMTPSAGLRGRIVAAAQSEQDEPADRQPVQLRQRGRDGAWRRVSRPYALAAAFGLIALAMLVWNIALIRDSELPPPEGTATYAFRGLGGSGEVTLVSDPRIVVVRLEGLANLPADQDYQVWAIDGGTPRSLGLLTVLSGEATLAAAATGAAVDAIAVTIEPAGGSPEPTSEPILTAEI